MSRPDGTTPILSISKRDAFRILVCGLHVLGSIVAAVFCFLCDAQKSRQIATVPFALPLSVSPLRNMSHARASRTAFPWGEDDGEPGHLWNPFLLVLAFEWLTACYAMCNLTSLFKHILWPAMGWLATGLAIVITWFALNSGALGVSLPIVLVWAFVTTAVLCIRFDRLRPSITAPIAPVAPVVVPSIMDGRIWLIPKTIAGLKVTGRAIFTPNTLNSEQQEYERVTGVLNRYAEYCVTAPLLFLAVTCLLVPDAPSWLFITGFLFILGCNLFGVILHYTTMYMYKNGAHKKNDDPTPGASWWGYMLNLIYTGTWRSPYPKRLYLLSAAWLSLLLPMSGLVYMTRGYLFSAELPALVAVMIWNLFLTYSLFGIIPTFMYVSWIGFDRLDLVLDVLNAVAKFPIPMQILYGYIARPAGVHPCFS